jgi:hypothetical protein
MRQRCGGRRAARASAGGARVGALGAADRPQSGPAGARALPRLRRWSPRTAARTLPDSCARDPGNPHGRLAGAPGRRRGARGLRGPVRTPMIGGQAGPRVRFRLTPPSRTSNRSSAGASRPSVVRRARRARRSRVTVPAGAHTRAGSAGRETGPELVRTLRTRFRRRPDARLPESGAGVGGDASCAPYALSRSRWRSLGARANARCSSEFEEEVSDGRHDARRRVLRDRS